MLIAKRLDHCIRRPRRLNNDGRRGRVVAVMVDEDRANHARERDRRHFVKEFRGSLGQKTESMHPRGPELFETDKV